MWKLVVPELRFQNAIEWCAGKVDSTDFSKSSETLFLGSNNWEEQTPVYNVGV
jgi:hypothetical protein